MKTHKTTITESPATEDGALDGWLITCDDCGPVSSFSILSMTQKNAADHTRLMIKWGK